MSEKFPAPSYRDITKVAKRLGFYLFREAKGSHEVWRRETDGRQTTISHYSGSKSIKRKTLKAIIDDFGVNWKEFKKILNEK